MSEYFKYFPDIKYKGKVMKNITKRIDFIEKYLDSPVYFLPLTLNDDEKPEDICYNYYGTVKHTNFILLMNGIYNPYIEWLMDENKFNIYLGNKYMTQSGKENTSEVVNWTKNNKLTENILYFYDENGLQYSVDTIFLDNVPVEYHNIDLSEPQQEFILVNYINPLVNVKPYRIYDMEYDNNEDKRQIFVINKNYIDKVVQQYKKIMGEN